ncbi:MAG TPA: tetratricopeptide repeat protein [Candidatus Saccharicenans sp.]|nr:tetratricopeptide repeat protein [Candidatus Saccharicenans sp.]HRD01147.1 tetratricopeptide repeat protein [Candidatus Saccharicenans sp.]
MRRNKFSLLIIICLVLFITGCASSQSQSTAKQDKDPQYQYNLGLFYLNNNNVDEAIKCFNRSLSLNANNYLAWNALGLAQSMKTNFEASLQAFIKALAINPQFTEARNNLGTIYFELKQYDKAETEYRQALLDPAYTSRELPYYNLARLYFVQDRLEEAYDHVQKALQIKFRFGMAHNLRGLILEKMGDPEEAENAFAQAVKIVPDDSGFLFNLAKIQFDNGRYLHSKENFEKLLPRLVNQADRDEVRSYLEQLKTLVKD